jgi:hypothetical protein
LLDLLNLKVWNSHKTVYFPEKPDCFWYSECSTRPKGYNIRITHKGCITFANCPAQYQETKKEQVEGRFTPLHNKKYLAGKEL